jgi:hypothetical protein
MITAVAGNISRLRPIMERGTLGKCRAALDLHLMPMCRCHTNAVKTLDMDTVPTHASLSWVFP